jgi:N-methylhydantoinase B/oxoprolinase/acetone carboxylase alpha subunit
MTPDPIELEVMKHLLQAVPLEMGEALARSAFSPNIRERRDLSCAIFSGRGELIAQAAHIPVHLGSTPRSVHAAIEAAPRLRSGGARPGDVILLNDPYAGGTHLPDLTLVSPVFLEEPSPAFWVACRAHHADVGGATAGSMGLARTIFEEGLRLPPVLLVREGTLDPSVLAIFLANTRGEAERRGDLLAQAAANRLGAERLVELVARHGRERVERSIVALADYAGALLRERLRAIPPGRYSFADALDDDGTGSGPIRIQVELRIADGAVEVDFTGTAPEVEGPLNANEAVTASAVLYCFRTLLDAECPENAGLERPIKLIAPPGTVVNARFPRAVAGGNVETSQRIVDVVLGALAQALPGEIPAASQGSMNNLAIGGLGRDGVAYAYYETLAGGEGASLGHAGASGVHTHMTNTQNTPIEVLEQAYPFVVERTSIRRGSGGDGRFRGGDGVVREVRVLAAATATLLAERRRSGPFGLAGGSPGAPGRDTVTRASGVVEPIPSKARVELAPGDTIRIETPGGGGFGCSAPGPVPGDLAARLGPKG